MLNHLPRLVVNVESKSLRFLQRFYLTAVTHRGDTALQEPQQEPQQDTNSDSPVLRPFERPVPNIRSIQFIPTKCLTIELLTRAKADVSVLDMEDSIPLEKKLPTRNLYSKLLTDLNFTFMLGTNIYIRINQVRPDDNNWLLDLMELAQPSVSGFMVAKTESANDIRKIDNFLSLKEREQGLSVNHYRLCPTIESPHGVRNVREICSSSSRLNSVIIGNQDLAAALHCSVESPTIYQCYHKVVAAAKTSGISPLYGCFSRIDDRSFISKELKNLKNLGFKGSACMNTAQLTLVQSAFGRR